MAGPFYVDTVDGADGNAGTSEGAGNAWQTLQKAADTAVAGEIVYIKASANYTLTATCDFDTNSGTVSQEITFIGYTSTIADNGKITVTKTGSVADLFDIDQDYTVMKNMIFTGSDDDGVFCDSGSTRNVFENCLFHTNNGSGFYDNSGYSILINCEAYGNTGAASADAGIALFQVSKAINCYSHDNTKAGFRVGGSYCQIIGCIAEANSLYGILVDAPRGLSITNSIIDANTSAGIRFNVDSDCSMVYNNLITNHDTGGESGILIDSGEYGTSSHIDWNAFYENDTDIDGSMSKGPNTITLSADPYTNRAGHDFTLNSTAGGGTACKNNAHLIGILSAPIGSSYLDTSALQAQTIATDYPSEDDVRDGVDYDSANYTGNMTLPSIDDVQESVQFGTSGTEYTGVFGVPAENEVGNGVGYGANDTEFTGSANLEGSGPVPDCSGIIQLEKIGGGAMKVQWNRVAASGTLETYNIYARPGSATNLFTNDYLIKKVDESLDSSIIIQEADNDTLFDGTQAIYVGIRGENNGLEDSNTLSLNITPEGTGRTFLKIPEEFWSIR
ncbi:MAG: hypothetical protein DRP42_02775 [Tenericutes bacterium]|nr:MAG: hypothetical protein DRP42_02775 [Mycoplasmatota bacterium]